jgi:hypothetical protein
MRYGQSTYPNSYLELISEKGEKAPPRPLPHFDKKLKRRMRQLAG